MKTVSIRDAKHRLTELAGETFVVTRNGRPVFDLVPHQTRKGLRFEAIDQFRRKHRIKMIVSYSSTILTSHFPRTFCFHPAGRAMRFLLDTHIPFL
jgi:antitoxin (DNA-binding transcriptional repressor) of toxin-antitoxin stability system